MSHGRPGCALDIEGQPVSCIETEDSKRVWQCDCAKLKARATRHPEGFCAHTAVTVWRCIEDGSIVGEERRNEGRGSSGGEEHGVKQQDIKQQDINEEDSIQTKRVRMQR